MNFSISNQHLRCQALELWGVKDKDKISEHNPIYTWENVSSKDFARDPLIMGKSGIYFW